jgi:hypothetical protein
LEWTPERGKAEQDVARRHALSGQLLAAFHRADAEAGQVIVAGRVHARHFRRLAADQRAAGHAAAIGDAGDDTLGNAVVELAGGEIIEEEQRFGALHDQVVDAHGDQVDADGIVPVMIDRQFHLGADAIVGGDQQRVLEPRRARIEEPAEPAEFGVRAGPRGGPGKRRDGFHQRIAGGNRDACGS